MMLFHACSYVLISLDSECARMMRNVTSPAKSRNVPRSSKGQAFKSNAPSKARTASFCKHTYLPSFTSSVDTVVYFISPLFYLGRPPQCPPLTGILISLPHVPSANRGVGRSAVIPFYDPDDPGTSRRRSLTHSLHDVSMGIVRNTFMCSRGRRRAHRDVYLGTDDIGNHLSFFAPSQPAVLSVRLPNFSPGHFYSLISASLTNFCCSDVCIAHHNLTCPLLRSGALQGSI